VRFKRQAGLFPRRGLNGGCLLSVLVDMSAITCDPGGQLPADADAAIRQLYFCHAEALHVYVERFCTDRTSADDVVQETFIRAWRHLPKLSADDRPIRPWLYRVARNLLIDADRAARAHPVLVQALPDEDAGTGSALDQVLDRELVSAALQHLSPAHRAVVIEAFYNGGSLVAVARKLGIPHGTARSRMHYALQALRQQVRESDAIAC
jgi:RNA polymerase sigma-70 factor, ECF subfamily